MTSERMHEDKGRVKPQPENKSVEPAKEEGRTDITQARGKPSAGAVQQMQQAVGNAAVQRFLAQRQGDGPTEIDEETASSIQSARGGGQSLDGEMAERAGAVMGHDFGDVKVHTSSEADGLNRDLGARAFTTGKDIFFREGAYNPASSDGQELIAHELTHVAQQGSATPSVQTRMMVNDPHDQYEAEADQVAQQVMDSSAPGIQRQAPEEEEELVQGQEMEEEETVQAQEMEEEEEMIQAQQMPEEEEALQMQEMEEEETIQAQETTEDEELAA